MHTGDIVEYQGSRFTVVHIIGDGATVTLAQPTRDEGKRYRTVEAREVQVVEPGPVTKWYRAVEGEHWTEDRCHEPEGETNG